MRFEISTLAASFLWGSSFVVIKFGLNFIGPLSFAFFRFLTASFIIVVLFLLMKKRLDFKIFKNRYILILGLTNALGILLQFVGLTLTTATKTALLVNVNVVVVAILSHFMFKERLSGRREIAILSGILGVFLLTTKGDLNSLKGGEILGDILVLLAGVVWALYIVYSKKAISENMEILKMTFGVMPLTAFFLFPFLILGDFSFNLQSVSVILYTGIFCTIAALMLWLYGLKEISATASSVILLAEILFAVILAFLFLGETLTLIDGVGGFFIVLAVGLVTVSK
ncbi:MAG: DMT family transporter [Candidatus Methanofastidiosia archaeon]